jgi:hypothetical protein
MEEIDDIDEFCDIGCGWRETAGPINCTQVFDAGRFARAGELNGHMLSGSKGVMRLTFFQDDEIVMREQVRLRHVVYRKSIFPRDRFNRYSIEISGKSKGVYFSLLGSKKKYEVSGCGHFRYESDLQGEFLTFVLCLHCNKYSSADSAINDTCPKCGFSYTGRYWSQL